MAKLIINFFALLMIVLLVSHGLPKAEAQTCFKGEAQEGVCTCVELVGATLCDLLCKANTTTWVGKCEVEDKETHCHCYGPGPC